MRLVPSFAVALFGAFATAAFAQGALRPVDALVVNTPANPVPVVGTVKIDGGVGAISGSVKSSDKTITAYQETILVSTGSFGNAVTEHIDVSGFKEVRVAISNGSCGPCSEIEVAVYVASAAGSRFEIDGFKLMPQVGGVADVASRTYSVPGERLIVSMRGAASSNNSVRVVVFGRAN